MGLLKNQNAIIIGASGDIGKAIAKKFAKEGANIIVSSYSRKCFKLAEKLSNLSYKVTAISCDFENIKSIEKLINLSYKRLGSIDILVNSVGIIHDKLSLQINEDLWDKILKINLKGSFFSSQYALKYMLKACKGKIINISSIIAMIGNIGQSHYAASKSALIAMSKSLAKEFGSKNIQINCILPGFIESSMLKSISERKLNQYKSLIPLQRFGKANDIAHMAVFLASKKSNYITGQKFIIDGGFTMY